MYLVNCKLASKRADSSLNPPDYREHRVVKDVSRLGFEPRTPALKGQCSTVELPARNDALDRIPGQFAFVQASLHAL